jgi:DNA-binding LacI/PurR family transcriptional regulator
MPVTAIDIAARLGLSQPTVSRILNDVPGYRVSPDTRQRVLEIARELGYQPNAVARSLRRKRTHIVGFYSGYGFLDARNEFLAEIIGAIQRNCERHQLDLLLHSTHRGRSTDDIYAELVNGRIDGLFLHTAADDSLVERLISSSLHVVALVDAVESLPSSYGNDEDGMRQLIEHLWDKGYRKYFFLSPVQRFASVERRRAAFQQELSLRGISQEEMQVIELDMEDPRPAIDVILSRSEKRTVCCCWNDSTAYNLVRICRQHGVKVPQEIAVTGFDGFRDLKMPAGQLTTVSVPYTQIAEAAVEALVQQIAGNTQVSVPVFPVTILPGDTT